ncbi:MAG: hypothetical protein HQ541_18885 [Mariniphaga sp.]|nr:hypothetical protein [Mariniphaga sp.]
MFQEVNLKDKKRSMIGRNNLINFITPIRPLNGTKGIECLRQNKPIEVENEIVYWFVEELEKYADFSFYYHIDKYHKGWTTLCKYEG